MLDYQHKLTTWLVREYDLVAVEGLDVKPMLETSQNAKNKQDAAWSRFLDLLEYKADLHGTHVVRLRANAPCHDKKESKTSDTGGLRLVVIIAVIGTAFLTFRSLSGNAGNDGLPETESRDNGGVGDNN